MALTRKLLEGMGIDEKQVETIIEAHTETVDGLKAVRDKFKEQASKVPDLQKQLEEAKEAAKTEDGWEEKYNQEHKALEDFKAQVDKEKAEAAKAKAYRAMLTELGIDPRRIETVMRVSDLSEVELEDGKLKDADALREAAGKEWADFIVKHGSKGSDPATPPKSDPSPSGADPEVEKRMAARNARMFGTTEKKES